MSEPLSTVQAVAQAAPQSAAGTDKTDAVLQKLKTLMQAAGPQAVAHFDALAALAKDLS